MSPGTDSDWVWCPPVDESRVTNSHISGMDTVGQEDFPGVGGGAGLTNQLMPSLLHLQRGFIILRGPGLPFALETY